MNKKKPTKKKHAKRTPQPDSSQSALAAVEKLIGGTLADGMKKNNK